MLKIDETVLGDRPLDILLVEDSPTNAKIIGNLLKDRPGEPPNFTYVDTLAEARKVVEERTFDVVLLDLVLPDSEGLDTVRGLLDRPIPSPVIVLTSNDDREMAIEALKLGCQDYLLKRHVNPDMLWRVIQYSLERNQIESELEARRREFADYAETASDWFWETSAEFNFTFLSNNFEAITGVAPDVFLGKTDMEIGLDADMDINWAHHRKEMREHKAFRGFEFPYMIETGDVQWFRINGKPVFDALGEFKGYRGTGSEITLEKFSEWEIKQGKELLEGILYASMDGIVVLDTVVDKAGFVADFKFVHVNRRAEEMLTRGHKEMLGKLLKKEMPHMVEHGLFDRLIQTLQTGSTFDVEHFYNSDTMRGWFHIIGVKLNNSVVLTIRDISAQKEAEREQKLAATVFATSSEAMLVSDHNNHVIAINPAFIHVMGYTKDDILGKNPDFLYSAQNRADFLEGMWAQVEQTGSWVGVVWTRHKNGGVNVQRLSLSVIRNERGQATNYVSIFSDITEIHQRAEQLQHQANHDALTELPTRNVLCDRLEFAMRVHRRDADKLAVMMIDLDGFKPVNDDFGHLIGDEVLREVSKRLAACVRQSDTISRFGGDEFVVLALGIKDTANLKKMSQNLIDAVTKPIMVNALEIELSASIGIALFPEHGNDVETLIRRADEAMYKAKDKGKGQCLIANEELIQKKPQPK